MAFEIGWLESARRELDLNQGDRNFHTLTIHQYTQYIPSGIVI